MSDIFDNFKRIKVFEKIFVAISNNKFIIKDLEKPNEHQTMSIGKNGIVDVHKTVEGSNKSYESLGKFDLVKTAKKMIANPDILINAFKEMANGLKEVNFDEPEYAHFTVALPQSKEQISKLAKKEKRGIVFPLESLNDFDIRKLAVPWKDAKSKINENALVFDKELPVGLIWKNEEKCFFLSLDIIENSSISKFIDKMTHPEKVK